MALCGWYQAEGLRWQDPAGGALTFAVFGLVFYCLVATLEEVLFRGTLLRILDNELGTWIALAVSAVIFGGTHLLNENASLWSAVAIALECGILFGAAFILTRQVSAEISAQSPTSWAVARYNHGLGTGALEPKAR